MSEVTPRNDNRDTEVCLCNDELHRRLTDLENIYIVRQENLRDDTWSKYRDEKHINDRWIPLYAGNLKSGLMKAQNKELRHKRHTHFRQDNTFNYPTSSSEALYRPHFENNLRPNTNDNPVNHRLLNISQNNATQMDAKQTLISKLSNVIKCLEGW